LTTQEYYEAILVVGISEEKGAPVDVAVLSQRGEVEISTRHWVWRLRSDRLVGYSKPSPLSFAQPSGQVQRIVQLKRDQRLIFHDEHRAPKRGLTLPIMRSPAPHEVIIGEK
jgi:hypothetical protein